MTGLGWLWRQRPRPIVPVAAVSTTNAAPDAVTAALDAVTAGVPFVVFLFLAEFVSAVNAAVNAHEADKSKGQAVIDSAIHDTIVAINAFLSLPAIAHEGELRRIMQASPRLAIALALAKATDPFCVPHKNRGVEVLAVRVVNSVPMCIACVEGIPIKVESRFAPKLDCRGIDKADAEITS